MKIQNRVLQKSNAEDLKILKTVSEAVDTTQYSDLSELKRQMIQIMQDSNGIGLSAPQVGLNKRIFVMERQNGELLFLVNPTYVKKSQLKFKFNEGCLSVPGKHVNKNRSRQVTIRYYDENLQEQEIRLGGQDAVCAQHEIDHLDGKII